MYIDINEYVSRVRLPLVQKGVWAYCKATVEVVGLFVPPGYDLPQGHDRKLALLLTGSEEDIEQTRLEIMRVIGGGAKYMPNLYAV